MLVMDNRYDYEELYSSSYPKTQTKIYDKILKQHQLDIIDTVSYMWKTSTTNNLNFPSDEKTKEYELLKRVLQQIVDLDLLGSEEYVEKYGKDADFDPYVIATKAKSAISD